MQFLVKKTYSGGFELDFHECEICLKYYADLLFSVKEIEGVSLPKKKEKIPRRVSEDPFFSMGLYSLAV